MTSFLTTLEELKFSIWVRESGSIWAYPTILFTHTIGMAMVAGLSAAIDLRLLGFASKVAIRPLERLYPLIWLGFALNLVSGSILLVADATTKLTNPDFYVKMVFVFGGVALLAVMRNRIFRSVALDKEPLPASAKRLAFLSLVCWVGAVTAGRLLAYLGPVSGLPGLENR